MTAPSLHSGSRGDTSSSVTIANVHEPVQLEVDSASSSLRIMSASGDQVIGTITIPGITEDVTSAKRKKKLAQLIVSWNHPAAPPAAAARPVEAERAAPEATPDDDNDLPPAFEQAPTVRPAALQRKPAVVQGAKKVASDGGQAADDDDLPPALEKAPTRKSAAAAQARPAAIDSSKKLPAAAPEAAVNAAADLLLSQAQSTRNAKAAREKIAAKARERAERQAAAKAARQAANDSGMRGFLSRKMERTATKSAPSSAACATTTTSGQQPRRRVDHVVSGSGDASASSSVVLPEVQAKMAQDAPAAAAKGEELRKLANDKVWMTERLQLEIASDPELVRGLGDPDVQRVKAMMQSNPAGAQAEIAKCAKLQAFFTRFCKLMGSHFTGLAQEAAGAAGAAPAPSKQRPERDEKKNKFSPPMRSPVALLRAKHEAAAGDDEDDLPPLMHNEDGDEAGRVVELDEKGNEVRGKWPLKSQAPINTGGAAARTLEKERVDAAARVEAQRNRMTKKENERADKMVSDAMSNGEVRRAFGSEKVQKVIVLVRRGQHVDLQMAMRADPELARDLQILIRAGVIGTAR